MTHAEQQAYEALIEIDEAIKETAREMIVVHLQTIKKAKLPPERIKALYDIARQDIPAIIEAKKQLAQRDRDRLPYPRPMKIGSVLKRQIG